MRLKMVKIIFILTGTGRDVHGQNITKAGSRALKEAIHYISMLDVSDHLLDGDIHRMKTTVKLAVPKDSDQINKEDIKKLIPYGEVTVEVMIGGMATTSGILLEDQQDENDLMYIVNASIEVGY